MGVNRGSMRTHSGLGVGGFSRSFWLILVGPWPGCWGYQLQLRGTRTRLAELSNTFYLLWNEQKLPLTSSDSSPHVALALYTEQVQGFLQILALGRGRWWNGDVYTVYFARAQSLRKTALSNNDSNKELDGGFTGETNHPI